MKFRVQYQPMKYGAVEAMTRKYKKFIGKSGKIWLVADQPNEADNIYVEGGKRINGFEGFGGNTLQFKTVDGEILDLQGPWHSNPDALFQDTGYDCRNKHQTFVVISAKTERVGTFQSDMVDILHIDPEPQISEFSRGKELAQKIANEQGIKVHLYSQSDGGSLQCCVEPE